MSLLIVSCMPNANSTCGAIIHRLTGSGVILSPRRTKGTNAPIEIHEFKYPCFWKPPPPPPPPNFIYLPQSPWSTSNISRDKHDQSLAPAAHFGPGTRSDVRNTPPYLDVLSGRLLTVHCKQLHRLLIWEAINTSCTNYIITQSMNITFACFKTHTTELKYTMNSTVWPFTCQTCMECTHKTDKGNIGHLLVQSRIFV